MHIKTMEKAKQRGYDVPQLDEMPEVPPGLGHVVDIFYFLHATRSFGFGPNPIGLRDIIAACEIELISGYARDVCIGHIRAMDAAWLKCYTDDQKERTKDA